jgi:cytidine deaminase
MTEKKPLSSDDQKLVRIAQDAAKNAYAHYSGFKVGAALRTKGGGVFSGCNVENVSFPLGTCAERNAIAAAVLAEGAAMEISEIAIMAFKKGKAVRVIPYGGCRQAICEFGRTARVIFLGAHGELRIESIENLLPDAFTF